VAVAFFALSQDGRVAQADLQPNNEDGFTQNTDVVVTGGTVRVTIVGEDDDGPNIQLFCDDDNCDDTGEVPGGSIPDSMTHVNCRIANDGTPAVGDEPCDLGNFGAGPFGCDGSAPFRPGTACLIYADGDADDDGDTGDMTVVVDVTITCQENEFVTLFAWNGGDEDDDADDDDILCLLEAPGEDPLPIAGVRQVHKNCGEGVTGPFTFNYDFTFIPADNQVEIDEDEDVIENTAFDRNGLAIDCDETLSFYDGNPAGYPYDLDDLFDYFSENNDEIDTLIVTITEVGVPDSIDVSYEENGVASDVNCMQEYNSDEDLFETFVEMGVVCVIDNTSNPTTLTVNKVCEPAETVDTFTVNVNPFGDLTPVATFELECGGDPGTDTNTIEVDPGTYVISEVQEAGYDAPVINGVCQPGGVVVIAEGDEAVCTITNTVTVVEPEADPELTIVKSCTGDEFDDASFTVTVGAELINEPITCEGLGSQIELTLAPGDYILSEAISGADSANFETLISCVEGGVVTNTPGIAAGLSLEAGDVVVCIITNQHDDPTDGEDLPPPEGPGGNENDNTNVNTNINDINIGIDNSLTNDNTLTNENSLINDNINTNENNQEQINDNNQVIEVNASPIVTVGD
jgi:hypothetical protein